MNTKVFTSTLTFTHGEKTCASEPGKFCNFFGTRSFGTQPVCLLFGGDLHMDKPHGWTMRGGECLALDKETK